MEAPVSTSSSITSEDPNRPIGLTALSGIDRAAHHRLDEAWLAAAWSHPSTRVFVVSGGQALIDENAEGHTELVMTPPFEAPLTEEHRYFLGTDTEGIHYFALQKDALPGRMDQPARAAGLREAGLLEIEKRGQQRLYTVSAKLKAQVGASNRVLDLGCCLFRLDKLPK